ncbi:hypothetical protein BBI17_008400 [Phytophthora kernoviae]|uniref:RxLR effector protein n=1 Tax=Phytophthora kernoviae TaxID=325452 RepID=A0A3R7GK68_9STRA|nr:hypothetical protein BBI17_008400 [Phytophthora kernoviae]
MRPCNVLLLTLALLFAFSNAVLAVTPVTATAVSNEANYKRSLRVAETTTNSVDDEEERGLLTGLSSGLNKLKEKARLMKMRFGAAKESILKHAAAVKVYMKAKFLEKFKKAEAAEAAKAAEKAEKLKATKAAKAAAKVERIKAAEVAKAAKEAAKAERLKAAEVVTTAKAVAKAEKLKATKAAKAKAKANDAAAKEESMVTDWLNKLITPEKVYKDLGLTSLGARATKSKNYRIYEDYLKQYYQRMDAFF